MSVNRFSPRDKTQLQNAIQEYLQLIFEKNIPNYWEHNNGKGLINEWDVSNITDMSHLFVLEEGDKFNDDIGKWDVSNVINMEGMFIFCESFNQSLNDWDVSKVKNMKEMFSGCKSFNQPLNDWDVRKVKNMEEMFSGCKSFNQPLNKWDVINVSSMSEMFKNCMNFDQNLNNWNVSSNTAVKFIFSGSGIEEKNYPIKIRYDNTDNINTFGRRQFKKEENHPIRYDNNDTFGRRQFKKEENHPTKIKYDDDSNDRFTEENYPKKRIKYDNDNNFGNSYKEETLESFLDYLYLKGQENPNKPMVVHRNHVVLEFYLNYLLKKFGSECYLPTEEGIGRSGIDLSFDKNEDNTITPRDCNYLKKYHVATFKKNLQICLKNKIDFIIIPLSLNFYSNNIYIDGHENVIICRKDKNKNNTYIFEHFEPHGSYFEGDENKEKVISSIFEIFYLMGSNFNYEFKHSLDVCPNGGGIQHHYDYTISDEGGYCVMWSTFFTEICLRNPTLPSDIVYQKIMNHVNNDKNKMKMIIKGFTEKITEKLKKYYTEIIQQNFGDEVYLSTFFDNADESVWYQLSDLVDKIYETERDGKIHDSDDKKEILNLLKSNLNKMNKKKISQGGRKMKTTRKQKNKNNNKTKKISLEKKRENKIPVHNGGKIFTIINKKKNLSKRKFKKCLNNIHQSKKSYFT